MFAPAAALQLTREERAEIDHIVANGRTPQKLARRARIIALAADGTPNRQIATLVGVSRPTVIAQRPLDRTQPGLPMKKGRCARMTHDYKRHGTTTLFAALNLLDGKLIGQCTPRHRAKEFIAFLGTIDRKTPAELALHIVVDNYSAHKTEVVSRWLKRHRRFHLHFTPTSASWLNLVESWFATLTKQQLRRGVFRSVTELLHAIDKLPRSLQPNPDALRLDQGR